MRKRLRKRPADRSTEGAEEADTPHLEIYRRRPAPRRRGYFQETLSEVGPVTE